MKNTGRRIFRRLFALILVLLPFVALAGQHASQR